MPRRRRVHAAGVVFHVINRAAKRARLFENSADYAAFERLLCESAAPFQIALFAYCVMPNHWHLLLRPTHAGAVSRFMHWLTTTHSRRWQLAHDAEGLGAVYQGRFKAIPIACDHHFLWVCRYVERNALRANLVRRAEDWRWSSLWQRTRGDGVQWLAPWPIAMPPEWIQHVNAAQTEAEVAAFRCAIQNGEPFGDQEWRDKVVREFKLRSSRPRGRPRRPGAGSVL